MGWKGTIRSFQAAANRAEKARQREQNAAIRYQDRLARSYDQVVAKAQAFESKVSRDPIKTLSLSFSPHAGFRSLPFVIEADFFTASLSLTSDSTSPIVSDSFTPPVFQTISSSIRPLRLLLTPWATILAVEVTNSDPEYQMRTNWVRKSDPQQSRVVLIDVENSEYYYPIATDLGGHLISGHPRIGLVAFQPFRVPTNACQFHFIDVQLQKGRGGKQTFDFSYHSASLAGQIMENLQSPGLINRVIDILNHEVARIQGRSNSGASGCMTMLTVAIAACMAALLVVRSFCLANT